MNYKKYQNNKRGDGMFKGKTLLITGGTGSFGKTIIKKFIDTNIEEIRVFSRDEKKQEELRLELNNNKLKFYIGDVRDYSSLDAALESVDYVFHAAALKQVPSCEFYPMEAVKTNIIGTDNLIKASISNGTKKVIILSTDKAVYPINAMGISKAMAEKVVVASSRNSSESSPIFCCTRYGNVMASRGSVIPLFTDQILKGEEITVTDPNMTRFLMSLDDSVGLVLHAFKYAEPGDIFVQKAPASTIENIVKALKEIYGKKNKTRIIGTRHGEKLYESLISREEMARAEDMEGYYRIPADVRGLNYARYFSEGEEDISNFEDYTSHNTKRLTHEELKEVLLNLDYVKGRINSDN
tara:strand:- start:858 stop:1916 length:1059 start_codon:yes stop_codon:yes gene_type:complete